MTTMVTTMVADDDDNKVDGDGAMCDNDGVCATVEDNEDDDYGNDDDDGDGAMGDGTMGYDYDDDGDG
jgi:hypothetical protein